MRQERDTSHALLGVAIYPAEGLHGPFLGLCEGRILASLGGKTEGSEFSPFLASFCLKNRHKNKSPPPPLSSALFDQELHLQFVSTGLFTAFSPCRFRSMIS